jgi:hypothetical protein
MQAPMISPVSCLGGSTARMRPKRRIAAVVNGSPTTGSGKPINCCGERRPRLSIQSYEYGASLIWPTHGHSVSGVASTVIPRHACRVGAPTKSSHR